MTTTAERTDGRAFVAPVAPGNYRRSDPNATTWGVMRYVEFDGRTWKDVIYSSGSAIDCAQFAAQWNREHGYPVRR